MASLVVPLLIGLQFLLALASPTLLIYMSLLTGALPLTLGPEEMLSGDLGRMDLPGIRVLGLALAILLVLFFRLEDVTRSLWSYKLHLLFLSFCVCAISWSPSFVYGIRMVAKLTVPFLFILAVRTFVSSLSQLKTMEVVIYISGVMSVCLALATYGQNKLHDGMLTVPSTSPAVFSAHLVAVSMLALTGLLYGQRLLHILLLCVFVAATMAGFTRITVGALFLSSSVVLFLAMKGIVRFALPSLGAIALPALFLLSERFRNRMFYGGDSISIGTVISDPSYALDHVHGSGRFSAWSEFAHQFFEPSPAVGSGIGATQHYFYTHSLTGLGVIHSEYIRLLCEVGILGLILFLSAAMAYGVRMVSLYHQHPSTQSGRYALTALGAMIAYLVFLATDNGFDYVSQFGIYVFGYVAMSEQARELESTALDHKTGSEVEGQLVEARNVVATRKYPLLSIPE